MRYPTCMELADRDKTSEGQTDSAEPVMTLLDADLGWFKTPPDGVHVLDAAVPGNPFRFVVVDVRDQRGDWGGVADWTFAFVTALRTQPGIDYVFKKHGDVHPSVLVVGKNLPIEFRQQAHSAGSVVYDFGLPSNASFQGPEQLVSHLCSLGRGAAAQDPAAWSVDPDADPAGYYKPVRGVTAKALKKYLDILNRKSP
jgi:hypothetical protein